MSNDTDRDRDERRLAAIRGSQAPDGTWLGAAMADVESAAAMLEHYAVGADNGAAAFGEDPNRAIPLRCRVTARCLRAGAEALRAEAARLRALAENGKCA